jgi:hypothetical protein
MDRGWLEAWSAGGAAVPAWAPCPTCWGQRRVWEPVAAANGEGAVYHATTCPGCLGIGERML